MGKLVADLRISHSIDCKSASGRSMEESDYNPRFNLCAIFSFVNQKTKKLFPRRRKLCVHYSKIGTNILAV